MADSEAALPIPRVPDPDHESLRRREAEYLAGSKLHVSGSAALFSLSTQSSRLLSQTINDNYPTQSADHVYATQSVPLPYSLVPISQSGFVMVLPSVTSELGMTSSTSTQPYSAASSEVQPFLYTGSALENKFSVISPISVTLVALYLAL
jgi:hypothetical protein